GEFNFVLRDGAGDIIDRASNDSKGNIVFQNRRFSRTGTFLYSIEEVKGSNANIRYDNTRYTVKVIVNSSQGNLDYKVDYLKNDVPFGGDITFSNTYGLPQTGDNQPNLILGLFAASILTLLIVLPLSMKKRKTKEE
ncbi:MAG: LPXTG cell wall anchor domain-containing protein, partial [Clostridiales bacterium]|nr:LPXTG cell wall anchor domain-containing protein [Clostridiales bacterium]